MELQSFNTAVQVITNIADYERKNTNWYYGKLRKTQGLRNDVINNKQLTKK